ncbi:hypothetical protein [Pseudomonas aeruginosa]|uniref:hypothetical protein n=1 Tax=Pseudomonas aeruginosa TaxID=287 RepID=UPI0015953258|nr:hypothetical protein [Pseudomonas aeruginosa]
MKPCTLGKRHSWTFVRNVVTSHLSGRVGRITKRGLYRCECGNPGHQAEGGAQ